jgi:transposase-like protein
MDRPARTFVLPVPLSRWSHHTPRSRTSQPNIGTENLIPVNNPLERIMKEIRRRTRVVGAFPDGQSCLNLAAARLRYIAGTAWSVKCYMNMRPLYQPQVTQTEAVA